DFGNILPTFFFFLITVHLTCEGSIYKKSAVGLLFSSTVLAFNTLRDNYLINTDMRCHDHLYATMIFSFSSILFSLFLFLGTRILAPEKNYELSDNMWRLLILLTVPPLGIVFSLVLLYDITFWDTYSRLYANTSYFHREYMVLLIIALFSFIGLLWAIVVLARQQKLEQQNALADINNSYYEAMEQHSFEIRRLKHDMANHLQILSALPTEEQQTYLDSLSQNTALTQTLHYCGDTTINAVLAVKENQMNRYGIRLVYTIDIPEELPFEQTDLCALFANALDNAMEACRQSEEGNRERNSGEENSAITLESRAQKGLFCLNVKNPIAGTGREIQYHSCRDGSLPASSKQDRRAHGLGLKSMLEIVRKYHGEMELKTENGMAELFLYMPMYGK
ncbi:MAG: GHKL domain-containing protein, partial [Lachnospiraceae bacterium]|nr:GHKL domain-containing protein [Lachnospiraceae bacterium]